MENENGKRKNIEGVVNHKRMTELETVWDRMAKEAV